jgi:hypothetical protein
MKRIIELRDEGPTAAYISDALRLQAQFGHEHAADYLKALGVERELAQRMLGIRYDRRRPSIANSVRMGRDDNSAIRIPA